MAERSERDSVRYPPTIARPPDAAPTTKVHVFQLVSDLRGRDPPARGDGRSYTQIPTAADISYAT